MAEHGGRPLADDTAVPYRVFLTIGGFVAVMAAIYWFTAYEDAGTVMLVVAAVLAIWCGIYLWLRRRHAALDGTVEGTVPGTEPTAPAPAPEEAESSLWPFVIGLGSAATAVGLAVGLWIFLPGVVVTILGIVGFVREHLHDDHDDHDHHSTTEAAP